MQAFLGLLDVLEFISAELRLLELDLAFEELIKDLYAVKWLICSASLRFISLSV